MALLLDRINHIYNTFKGFGNAEKESILFGKSSIIQLETNNSEVVNFGTLIDNRSSELEFPALFSLKNTKGFILNTNESTATFAHNTLMYLSSELIRKYPKGGLKIRFVDLKNWGSNFPFVTTIDKAIMGDKIITNIGDFRGLLDEWRRESEELISLLGTKNIDDYNSNAQHIEPYRFLFIANFPFQCEREIYARLEHLLENARKIGFKIFLTVPFDNSYDITTITKELISFNTLNTVKTKVSNSENDFIYNTLYSYHFPIVSDIESRFERKQHIEISKELGVSIEIGSYKNQKFLFELGYSFSEKTTAHNAIIVGQPGSGKSTLFKALIANSLKEYSPDLLRFYILDLMGTGFVGFEDYPNVEMLFRTSDIENAIEVIKGIDDEIKTREELFRNAKVETILEYRKKGNILPRIIVIIDEFQRLFLEGHRQASFVEKILIGDLLKVGRKLGIHLIIATQSIGGEVSKKFLTNIPLRIGLQLSSDQSESLFEMGNKSASEIGIGSAIYNDQSGNRRFNKLLKINEITDAEIHQIAFDFHNNTTNNSYQKFEKVIL